MTCLLMTLAMKWNLVVLDMTIEVVPNDVLLSLLTVIMRLYKLCQHYPSPSIVR